MYMDKEIRFWSKELGVLNKQFRKPYIKQSKKERIKHEGGWPWDMQCYLWKPKTSRLCNYGNTLH